MVLLKPSVTDAMRFVLLMKKTPSYGYGPDGTGEGMYRGGPCHHKSPP